MFQTSRPSTASRSASSGGHASPPKINSRTASSATAGHSDASVGTVETTLMSRETSHGPRSKPDRTRERGAGTRQAPCRHASHISSQEASNATDRPASTRSPGPSGSFCRNIRASASTNAAALRWLTATPLGVPVEPEVKITHASSSGVGSSGTGVPAPSSGAFCFGAVPAAIPPAVTMAVTCASPKTSSARSSGSSASTGTYAAPTSRIDRIAT
ncbi:unannotated protein [freshwater metagenome]|uniref:Unannotated protein n=1 Tax=freshwater metagenome TaxID=449393 RepID=A0A6J7ERE0_9ZZZZ